MKKLLCIILIFTMCITLGGCYDSKEISRIAFVIAVGFDEDSYTFQIVKPSAFGKEGSEDSPLFTTTIKAQNVYIAMDRLNSSISERCDYSHIKMVIFSRNKLQKGIGNEIDAMLKSNDFHPNTRIAMCEGKVSEYMKDMEIPLDANPAEYYENLFKENFTEYSPDITLKDLQRNYKNQVTGNVIPVIGSDSTGMAVTKNYRLTGTSTTDEVLIYNILKEKDFEGNYPLENNAVVSLRKKKSKFTVNLSDETPLISVDIVLEGNIIWSEENKDKAIFEVQAKEQTESEVTEFLYKCSTLYKADIFEFHRLAKVNYLTIPNWEKEDWQGLFERANYNVTVNIDIKREGLNIE